MQFHLAKHATPTPLSRMTFARQRNYLFPLVKNAKEEYDIKERRHYLKRILYKFKSCLADALITLITNSILLDDSVLEY